MPWLMGSKSTSSAKSGAFKAIFPPKISRPVNDGSFSLKILGELHFPTVLDISSSRDLYFLTMVGGVNGHKDAHSATISEKQTLILMREKESMIALSASAAIKEMLIFIGRKVMKKRMIFILFLPVLLVFVWIQTGYCEQKETKYAKNQFPLHADEKTGMVRIGQKFTSAFSYSEGLAAVEINGKWGYINKNGLIAVPPQFDVAYPFSEGLAFVKIGKNWGCINTNGDIIVQPKFDVGKMGPSIVTTLGHPKYAFFFTMQFASRFYETLLSFSEGYALIKNDKWKCGFIDSSGNEITGFKFDEASGFSGEMARVCIGKRWGYINKSGEMVIKPQYNSASNFSEGLAVVEIGERWGYINKSGEMVIKPQYNSASNFFKGLASVKLGNKTGYIIQSGEMVIKPQFDEACRFYEGLAAVKIDKKWGYIDNSGNLVIKLQYDYADVSFSEGLAAVEISNKRGYINKSGEMVVSPQFDVADSFTEGLARVKIGKKWGYIDKSGEMVVKPQFDMADSFFDGFSLVKIDGSGYGFIDTKGKFMWDPRNLNLQDLDEAERIRLEELIKKIKE